MEACTEKCKFSYLLQANQAEILQKVLKKAKSEA